MAQQELQWFCKTEQAEFGPMTAAALLKLARQGHLRANHLVRKGAEGSWMPAGQIKHLFAPARMRPDCERQAPSNGAIPSWTAWIASRRRGVALGAGLVLVFGASVLLGLSILRARWAEAARADAMASLRGLVGTRYKLVDGKLWVTVPMRERGDGATHSLKEIFELSDRLPPIHALGPLPEQQERGPRTERDEFMWTPEVDETPWWGILSVPSRERLDLQGIGALEDLEILSCAGLIVSPSELQHLTNLKYLTLRGTGIRDKDLVHLRKLTKLESLDLWGNRVNGQGLVHLAECTGLKRLDLSSTLVDDAGLEHLSRLRNLEYLDLSGTEITDAGLQHLVQLGNLRELHLDDVRVTSRGLSRLSHLSNLTVLSLCGHATRLRRTGTTHRDRVWSSIEGDDLKALQSVSSLRKLRLNATHVVDEDMRSLQGLTNLYELHIDQTDVGGRGLELLRAIPSLRRLHCIDSLITKRDEEQSRQERPDLDIWRLPRSIGPGPGFDIHIRERIEVITVP